MTDKKTNEMTKLLEEKQYFNFPKVGDLVQGKIIAAHKNEVHVDLDGVATGIIRGKECYNESEEYRNLKKGDEVEATVLEQENENGEIEMSFRYAGRQKAWQQILTDMDDGNIVEAVLTDANKGGLMVMANNTVGFLPVSQLSPEHYPRIPGGDKNRILEILKGYIGQTFKVKIMDADEREDKLIVSEKGAWEETQKDVMSKYKIGTTVEGTITAITDFGAFVEFDDRLEGLVHISEIAWQRIDDPHDFLKVGQKVKTEIIGIDKSKIFLSIKKLLKDPWANIESSYKIGQKVKGTVLKANPFGLFVELNKDIHGLAHVSQLSGQPVKDITAIGKAGDEMEFYIISIEPKKHRLGLSLMEPKVKKETKTEEGKEDTKEKKIEEKKTEKKEEKTKVEKEPKVAKEKKVKPASDKSPAGKKEKKDDKKIKEVKEIEPEGDIPTDDGETK